MSYTNLAEIKKHLASVMIQFKDDNGEFNVDKTNVFELHTLMTNTKKDLEEYALKCSDDEKHDLNIGLNLINNFLETTTKIINKDIKNIKFN
jgi:hypothetical protein